MKLKYHHCEFNDPDADIWLPHLHPHGLGRHSNGTEYQIIRTSFSCLIYFQNFSEQKLETVILEPSCSWQSWEPWKNKRKGFPYFVLKFKNKKLKVLFSLFTVNVHILFQDLFCFAHIPCLSQPRVTASYLYPVKSNYGQTWSGLQASVPDNFLFLLCHWGEAGEHGNMVKAELDHRDGNRRL